MKTLDGHILTPTGFVKGQMKFDARVIEITPREIVSPRYILPGFVDLHVHGGSGHDMMTGQAAIEGSAVFHAMHGTTSMLATSVTAPVVEIEAFLDAVQRIIDAPRGAQARILGAHLEGPFINPQKLGAQPDFAIDASFALARDWLARAPVKVMTLAPEMDADGEVLSFLQAEGVKVQIGHSLCCYAHAVAVLQNGGGMTHLFNAMSRLSHRDNGIVGAAFLYGDYVEIIPDLVHVEPSAILAAKKSIPHLYGVTDATAGAGMPDGKFMLGANEVIKTGEEIRLLSGSLAGSVLTMDVALRNLVGIGFSLEDAAQRLSTFPADWIGMKEIGRLEAGAFADFNLFDEDLHLTSTYIGGKALA